jgi:hypothetical protein
MAAPLQAGAQFQDLAQDPAFLSAPQSDQILYLMEDYLPKQDASFAQAPKAEQLQYIKEAVIPQLEVLKANGGALQPDVPEAPQIETPNWNDYDPNSPINIGKDLLGATLSTGAGALKGLSLGYLDATKPVEDFARNTIGAKYYSPEIATGGGELAGALPVFAGIGGGIKAGAQAVGRAALPLSTNMAQAAGVGSRFHRAALNAATWIQSGGVMPTAARLGAEMGVYEGLKSQPGQQLDIGQRVGNAAAGATTGAALGAAAPLLGRVAMNMASRVGQGAGKAIQAVREAPYLIDEVRGAQTPIGMGRMPLRQVSKRVQDANLKLRQAVRDLYEGKLDGSKLTEADIKALGQSMDDLERVIQGEAGIDAKAVANKAKAITGRVTLKARAASKVAAVKPGEPQAAAEGLTPEAPAPLEVKAPAPPKPAEQAQLTGSIQEMVDQGLKAFGGTIDDAKKLIAEVSTLGKAEDDEIIKTLTAERKALGSKRDEATLKAKAEIDAKIAERKTERKDLRAQASTIHPNLREVLATGWDGKSAIAEQAAVDTEKQLTANAVAEYVTDPAERKVLDQLGEAAEKGVSARVEHQAEVTGSTDAAAKVTSAGNVKVPVSTYTPTHFKTVEKGGKTYVAAMGYNEAGYQHLYYVTKSPEGSQILKVNKLLETEQHVGTMPNVHLGQRKYKVADVLKRVPEGEGIKTSEALENAQAFANLFTPEAVKQFSKPAQKMIRAVQKQGRFDEYTMRQLFKGIERDKQDLGKLCNIFGLKVP